LTRWGEREWDERGRYNSREGFLRPLKHLRSLASCNVLESHWRKNPNLGVVAGCVYGQASSFLNLRVSGPRDFYPFSACCLTSAGLKAFPRAVTGHIYTESLFLALSTRPRRCSTVNIQYAEVTET